MTAKYEVIDHNGDVAYDADHIAAMAGHNIDHKKYAEYLAKDASDPEAPAPHRVRKVQ